MTKMSTALVLVSGKGFGPFGSSGWRVSGWIELVEGGNSGPFLLLSSAQHFGVSERPVVLMSDNSSSTLGKAFLISVAHIVGGVTCEAIVKELPHHIDATGQMIFDDASRLTEKQRVDLAREVAIDFKLGVVALEPDSALNDGVQDFLGEAGFEVNLFSLE